MAPEADTGAPIRRALLSVHDKTGLETLARSLADRRAELWATDGTRRGLVAAGVRVRAAEELTGIGSWFGGRIKTLHPGLLGGVLAPRTDEGRAELAERKLLPFDLVVVNFYPFLEHLTSAPEADDREEFIDIGGVTLARAAAKNHAAVAVLSDPSEYGPFLEELDRSGGAIPGPFRRALAVRTFARCAAYDAAIVGGLADRRPAPFPSLVVLERTPISLRYGENPHQAAAVYRGVGPAGAGLPGGAFDLLKGDALSFTNLLDLDTAVGIVSEFSRPTAAVVKHATPCGAASAPTIAEAIRDAIATDPVARYGCAVAVNGPVDDGDLAGLHGVFVDLIAAPDVTDAARIALERRPKVKVVRTAPIPPTGRRWEAKSALGHLLLQDADRRQLTPEEFRPVTSRHATPEQLCALDFAWRVVRHAKSNAIVLARGSRTVGIGSGQPTRVKAVELAVEVAGERAAESVLASDAFFPFPDGVEVAGRAGVRAILQPGGSVRDAEVIAAAERLGVAMHLTGWRVFRH